MASPNEVYINVGEFGDLSFDVGESEAVSLSQGSAMTDVPVLEWRSRRPMNCPLPPRPHRSNSTLPAAANSRQLGPTLDEAVAYELQHGRTLDPNMDEKLLRRTISNRLAAKRSRLRRTQLANDLEKKMKDFQESIDSTRSQMQALEAKRAREMEENVALKFGLFLECNACKISQETTLQLIGLKEYYYRLYMIKLALEQSSNVAPAPAASEGMNNFDDDDVDQYLNLDADHIYPNN